MSKRGEAGGRKKLDKATLNRVAEIVKALFESTGYSVREAEKEWGIDKATLSHARNADGAVGVHFLIRLRELTGQPLDEMLGLPPLGVVTGPTHERLRRDRVLSLAIDDATSMGAPPEVIKHVVKTIAINVADEQARREAWLRAFLRTWSLMSLLPPVTPVAKEWLAKHPTPEAEVSEEDDWIDVELRRAVG